ncbi:MAG: tRNA preQ1(34) S-adenosylmethionine ribosyltransferase-isomerase QueA [Coriobacteriaceae bacterium]|nr:tRNA preQ1(34) S-adenosylmethionine ribosyltransferase-isomerase QueA [Coriobacteriaceae bacterium]
MTMLTAEFDYHLPQESIAQEPTIPRDSCRLLVLHRADGRIEHRRFSDIIEYLDPIDLLVANDTRVLPARLIGRKAGSGAASELLLLREISSEPDGSESVWEALVKPGRRLKPGARIECGRAQVLQEAAAMTASAPITAEILDWLPEEVHGGRLVRLSTNDAWTVSEALHAVGVIPLPPYITRYQGDRELYQTVFSKNENSAAAPTAGLHFTPELLEKIQAKGVGFTTVELEVGIDTFRPVDEERIEDHRIHTERYSITRAAIEAIEKTQERRGRVIAVGTTSVRTLESAYDCDREALVAVEGASTALYITPGYRFKVVDALLTNFHVPRSTLLMLVSAFANRQMVLDAYEEAVRHRYRFLSFGDAMLIL